MKNKSVMDHSFGAIPVSKYPRSVFNRSHGHKTTFDSDNLIPILWENILPGDVYSCRFHILTRLLSAALKPFMDNIQGSVYTFFVPYRILWDNWRKHMGEQDTPGDSISYNIPTIPTPTGAAGGVPIGHLFDYLGVPTEAAGLGGAGVGAQSINNLPGRAYNRIYNDHFRPQELIARITQDTGDGPDTWGNYGLQRITKRFDYFTSCLVNPQRGATAVSLPLGTSATVKTAATDLITGAQNKMRTLQSAAGAALTADRYMVVGDIQGGLNQAGSGVVATGSGIYPTNLYADLTNATAATINSLRQSITLQQFLEKDARGGTRLPEIIKNHFAGVVVPDFRAQRSEIIHIFNFEVKINPVANTSTTGTEYLGNLGAFGTAVSSGNHFVKSFQEHGILMSLMVLRSDNTYSQGLDRFWSYRTRYDHYWPVLANLGEQAVLNKEIYWNLADGTAANQKDGVFGYIGRHDEYRFAKSKITGLLRPGVTNTLGIWNLSELFSAQPTLGSTFIQQATPLDRAITVPSAPHWLCDMYFDVKHARIMPVYSIPGLKRL